jgi:hypothetical protein
MTAILWIVAITLIVIGIAGTILPALPGAILVFGRIVLAAWIDDFARIPAWLLVLLGVLTATLRSAKTLRNAMFAMPGRWASRHGSACCSAPRPRLRLCSRWSGNSRSPCWSSAPSGYDLAPDASIDDRLVTTLLGR